MFKPYRWIVLQALAFAALSGCTARGFYDGMQGAAKLNCQQQPSSEQARCEARLNQQDYDNYEKNRAATK